MIFVTTEEYKEEFARIISCKTLGKYNYVEKITVFLMNKSNNRTYNYYTIFAFGNSISPTFEKEYLTKKIISIEGMHCSHCSGRVEKTLLTIDGVKKAKVDLKKKEFKIKFI